MSPAGPTPQHHFPAAAMAAALAVGAVIIPAPAAATTSLDEANQRWQGARCRTRLEIIAKKKKSGDWSNCKPLFWHPKGGNKRVIVEVYDGAAVHRAFRKGRIPIGTEVKATGWVEEDNNVRLELEMVDHPVRLRVYYCDSWVGRVSVKRLDEFERWVKFELLEMISMPSEQLVDVQGVSASHLAAPTPAPRHAPPPPAANTPAAGPPAIEVLTASVQPARVAPGRETMLMIVYEVSGVPPGPGFEVLEKREIYQDGRRLADFEERLSRASGTFTSSQPLQLPSNLAPGIYTLRATVEMAGRGANGTALFEVTATP